MTPCDPCHTLVQSEIAILLKSATAGQALAAVAGESALSVTTVPLSDPLPAEVNGMGFAGRRLLAVLPSFTNPADTTLDMAKEGITQVVFDTYYGPIGMPFETLVVLHP